MSMAGACSGLPKDLPDEEEELETFLLGCTSIGCAWLQQQVMELVVRCKGQNAPVSHGW